MRVVVVVVAAAVACEVTFADVLGTVASKVVVVMMSRLLGVDV